MLDFRNPAMQRDFSITPGDMLCAWKTISLIEKKTPPTWIAYEKARTLGCEAALVPSAMHPDATNLVLWLWGPTTSTQVRVLDPGGDLPRDRSSWL